jgi:hypothetical protein
MVDQSPEHTAIFSQINRQNEDDVKSFHSPQVAAVKPDSQLDAPTVHARNYSGGDAVQTKSSVLLDSPGGDFIKSS